MNGFLTAIAGLFVVVALLLVGAYVEYSTGVPFALAFDSPPVAPPRIPPLSRNSPVPTPVINTQSAFIPNSSTTRTDVPIVSRAQGAQDAARADVPMGETADLQRCYATMIARKLIESEAKTVCAKLIGGISH